MHNKAVIERFFASFRFGVAPPLYPKTPLHKKCRIQRRYSLINREQFAWKTIKELSR